jgi:hypothetical protein
MGTFMLNIELGRRKKEAQWVLGAVSLGRKCKG